MARNRDGVRLAWPCAVAAESWEFSDDGLTLTFHLRENLAYADGSPLTAERFRYAIERSCDPRTEAPYAALLFAIAGCEAFFTSLEQVNGEPMASPAADDAARDAAYESARVGLGVLAVDDSTLELHLRQPAAYLPAAASTWVFFPVQAETVASDPEGWWRDPSARIGNGPFRVTGVVPDGDAPHIDFAANEHYWAGRPKLDGIEYRYFADSEEPEDFLEMYQRGEIDMIWPTTERTRVTIEADPALQDELVCLPRAATEQLGFNLNREPFQDKKVREAFADAFDRVAYCQEIGAGFCTPALSWIPPGVPGSIETDAYDFDPERAR